MIVGARWSISEFDHLLWFPHTYIHTCLEFTVKSLENIQIQRVAVVWAKLPC